MTSRSESHVVGTRPDYGAFIPAALDDYPLNPNEFRIYAHVLRRAGTDSRGHFESIGKTAKHCGMNAKTARNAMKVLQLAGMISVVDRPGSTKLITPTHDNSWASSDQVPEIRKRVSSQAGTTKSGRGAKSGSTKSGRGTPTKSGSTPLPNQGGVPLPREVHKGTPIEGTPNQGTPIEGIPPYPPTADGGSAPPSPPSSSQAKSDSPELAQPIDSTRPQTIEVSAYPVSPNSSHAESAGPPEKEKFAAAPPSKKLDADNVSRLIDAYNRTRCPYWAEWRPNKAKPNLLTDARERKLRAFWKDCAGDIEAACRVIVLANADVKLEPYLSNSQKHYSIETLLNKGNAYIWAERFESRRIRGLSGALDRPLDPHKLHASGESPEVLQAKFAQMQAVIREVEMRPMTPTEIAEQQRQERAQVVAHRTAYYGSSAGFDPVAYDPSLDDPISPDEFHALVAREAAAA